MWFLSSITSLFVVAVFVVSFFHMQDKRGTTDFLPINQSEKEEAIIQKTMAIENLKLEEVQKISLEDKFSEEFNRKISLSELDEISQIDINTMEDLTSHQLTVETIEVPYETLEYDGYWLEAGERLVTLAGVNGQAKVTYKDIYKDNVLVEKREIAREVLMNPVRQEIAVGSKSETAIQTTAPDVSQATTVINSSDSIPTVSEAPQTEAPNEITTTSPPTQTEATQDTSGQTIKFVSPGSGAAAATNHSLIAGMMKLNGNANYFSYTDNGNNTITVDGVTFAYDYITTSTITGYDGQEANNGYNKTSTGLTPARGMVATVMSPSQGYPYGTVLFIDGYGLVVVADLNGMGNVDSSWLDVAYNYGEINAGTANPGKARKTVYIISTP